jgi:hypothetical protein
MKTIAGDFRPISCEILEDDAAMSATNHDPSFRDFLRFVAMRRSLSMAHEYEKLSSFADTEEQMSFFSDMSDLKHNEFECLRRYLTDGRIVSLEAKNQPPIAVSPDRLAEKSFSTLETACHYTMNKELESYCLYLRLADLEEEMTTKRLFLYLVRMHKSSLDYVKNRLGLIASLEGLKSNYDAADACRNCSDALIA